MYQTWVALERHCPAGLLFSVQQLLGDPKFPWDSTFRGSISEKSAASPKHLCSGAQLMRAGPFLPQQPTLCGICNQLQPHVDSWWAPVVHRGPWDLPTNSRWGFSLQLICPCARSLCLACEELCVWGQVSPGLEHETAGVCPQGLCTVLGVRATCICTSLGRPHVWDPCASARTPSFTKQLLMSAKIRSTISSRFPTFFNLLGIQRHTMHLLCCVGGGLSFLQSLCQEL